MLSIYDLLVTEYKTGFLFCKVRHICVVMHADSITVVCTEHAEQELLE